MKITLPSLLISRELRQIIHKILITKNRFRIRIKYTDAAYGYKVAQKSRANDITAVITVEFRYLTSVIVFRAVLRI